LQLPLYRHLWPSARLDAPTDCAVQLGYFNLPKQLDKTAVDLAEWDNSVLEDADEQARWVIRRLRAAVFEPPTRPAPKYSEDFAAICLDNVFSGPALGGDDEGGQA
jgi:ATP-dependent helicase/nuclease subunit B